MNNCSATARRQFTAPGWRRAARSIEQDEIVRPIQAEDGDAIAAADAEFSFSARAVCSMRARNAA